MKSAEEMLKEKKLPMFVKNIIGDKKFKKQYTTNTKIRGLK